MPHVSNAENTTLTVPDVSLVTSIFPERDNTCYLMVQETTDECILANKTSVDHRKGTQLPGLITLKNYIDGGHEAGAAKVLVCVKSIGAKKLCKSASAWYQHERCCSTMIILPPVNGRIDRRKQGSQ